MKKAIIENNTVTNIIVVADSGFTILGKSLVDAQDDWRIGGHYDTGVYTAPEDYVPVITTAQVNAERDRRLALGFTFNGTPYDFDQTSKIRISGAGTLAGFAVAAGSPEGYYQWSGSGEDFFWIAQDNSQVILDAQTMFAMAQYAAQWEARHIKAARLMKDMETIPVDYMDDSYWPVRGT